MKEQVEKQVIQYATLEFMQLYRLAKSGDEQAEKELLAREAAQKAEIESLRVRANSKTRAPRAEKTPLDMAKDNAYFRCALLVKQFGSEKVDMQTLTIASAFLDQGLAQGNLRQAMNRGQQVLKAQAIEEEVFPAWILQAAGEVPQLDENKKLEEESEKIEQIKSTIQKYMDSEEQATEQAKNSEQPQTPAPAATSKKGSKK